jgi:hypothetical protein
MKIFLHKFLIYPQGFIVEKYSSASTQSISAKNVLIFFHADFADRADFF